MKSAPSNPSPICVNGKFISVFVSVCFFLSGTAGLVYETIWVRLIDKVIGSAPFAVATVLTVFMAGLALGSFLAGRFVDRIGWRGTLLSLYGTLEIGIALCALGVPLVIDALQPVYQAIYDRLLTQFWCYQAAAFAGCVLVLLLPAGLMGATLPVLCRYYVLRADHIGARTGWIYGLNTVGGALGVVLCGFVLIQTLGVHTTLCIFAGINGTMGIACLLLTRVQPPQRYGNERSPKIPPEPLQGMVATTAGSPGRVRWAAGLFAVSGFCAMAYEVLWTRLLGLIAGPTAYCFSLVVATFIVGLAVGSVLFGALADRTRHPFGWLAGTQMAAAGLAMGVSQLLGGSQFLFAKLIHTFQDPFIGLLMIQSGILFALLLPPTLLLGAAFPLVNRICIASMDNMGRTLGRVYALNTVGALSGSFFAGFVLIPWLGKMDSLRLVIAIQVACAGLALLVPGTMGNHRTRIRWAVCGLLAASLLLVGRYPSARNDLFSRGWYRDFSAIEADLGRIGWGEALFEGTRRIADHRQGLTVVFQGDGIGGFTTVEKETTSLGTVEYAMFNSGKADASSHGDRSTQTLSAHIPMLFHPNARHVMILGLASGMTAGEVLRYPVQRLDILEINSAVATACRQFFAPWNNRCLDDPRTRLIIQDGRNHLALTRETYDVIISEPSNPWMAGLANLYSREFFQLAKGRLTGGGIFAQWIQAYEMDWATFSLLGRTFASVFPDSALVKVGPVDYLMVGFKDAGGGFDWSTAAGHESYARSSTIVDFPGVDFLTHLVLTEDLPRLFGPGRLHTDDRPHLEFAAPKKLYHTAPDMERIIAKSRVLSSSTRGHLEAHTDFATLLDAVAFAASANVPMFNILPPSRLDPAQHARYRQIVVDYCRRVLVPSYDIFTDPSLKAECAGIQADAIGRRVAAGDAGVIDLYNLALARIAAGRKDAAMAALRQAVTLDPLYEPSMTALGLLLAENGNLDEACALLRKTVRLAPQKAAPHKYLGMVELRQGTVASAVKRLSTALALDPQDDVTLSELGTAYFLQGKPAQAIACLTQALDKNPDDTQSRYYLETARQQLAAEKNDARPQTN